MCKLPIIFSSCYIDFNTIFIRSIAALSEPVYQFFIGSYDIACWVFNRVLNPHYFGAFSAQIIIEQLRINSINFRWVRAYLEAVRGLGKIKETKYVQTSINNIKQHVLPSNKYLMQIKYLLDKQSRYLIEFLSSPRKSGSAMYF